MSEWRATRLGDICKIKYGKDHKHLAEGTIPVYGSGGIMRLADTALYCRKSVLIPRKGTLNNLFFVDTPFWTVDTLFYTEIDETRITPEFLYYQLKTLDLAGLNVGTAVPSLTTSILDEIEVMVPPLIEQKRIGCTLRVIDNRVTNNKKINHHLEQMAQAIFKSWFVDFEPWNGEMPNDWREVEFSSFLTPRTEKTNDPTVPLFSVTDTGIYPRSEKFNKKLSKASTKNKVAYSTDIVFGMSREILNWGIMRSPIGGVSSAYNVFAVDSGVNSKYLESFINAHAFYFKDLIRPATREGQGVDKAALMSKSIYLPPNEVLTEYYTIEDALIAQILEKEIESAHLAEIRDTLLPRLMSGELSVADIGGGK